ncbi:metallophosphoesterase [Synechocystis sp. B12]|nr:metallophosphoesterase [Synechocystis sp. B12]
MGDIHEQWELADHHALQAFGVDLVLFVGDFGNESLPVVSLIASLPIPKATVFGNHDAWFTASDWGRKNAPTIAKKKTG